MTKVFSDITDVFTLNAAPLDSLGQSGNVVVIGNFDGLHRGHRVLLDMARSEAKRRGLASCALTFSPSPRVFFRLKAGLIKNIHDDLWIFSHDQKIRAFAEAKFDKLVVKRFDEEFSLLSAESFVRQFLGKVLNARVVVIGENFRFGKDREGDVDLLITLGADVGIDVKVAACVTDETKVVSSSLLRHEIAEGSNFLSVTENLGRPYLIEGVIEQGDQLGRQIGFATANMGSVHQIIPRPGVYAGYLLTDEDPLHWPPKVLDVSSTAMPAVCNVGFRPSVSNVRQLRIEPHVIDKKLSFNLYGRRCAFYFAKRLRDEMKFENLESLRAQITCDIENARIALRARGTKI